MKKYYISKNFKQIEIDYCTEKWDKEIAKELWNELFEKELGFKLEMSNKQLIYFYIISFSLIIFISILSIVDLEFTIFVLELPYLKPIIMVTIPGLLGIRANRKNNRKN